jgi:hypothetical protein
MYKKAIANTFLALIVLTHISDAMAEATNADLVLLIPKQFALTYYKWAAILVVPLILLTLFAWWYRSASNDEEADGSHIPDPYWSATDLFPAAQARLSTGLTVITILVIIFLVISTPYVLSEKKRIEDEKRKASEPKITQLDSMLIMEEMGRESQKSINSPNNTERKKGVEEIAELTWQKYSPDGKPWPDFDTVPLPDEATGGSVNITIDVEKLSKLPAYVKLCLADGSPCKGLRRNFLKTLDGVIWPAVAPGIYEIRYIDLAQESFWRSEKFLIPQNSTTNWKFVIGKPEDDALFSRISQDEFN